LRGGEDKHHKLKVLEQDMNVKTRIEKIDALLGQAEHQMRRVAKGIECGRPEPTDREELLEGMWAVHEASHQLTALKREMLRPMAALRSLAAWVLHKAADWVWLPGAFAAVLAATAATAATVATVREVAQLRVTGTIVESSTAEVQRTDAGMVRVTITEGGVRRVYE